MISHKVSGYFTPSYLATGVLFLLTALFVYLGMWQTWRGAEKIAIEQEFAAAKPQLLEQAIKQESRFARIDVSGHYDNKRHILLDNQIWQGRVGVHVFTPFYTDEGTVILVNRGWVRMAVNRQALPEIPTNENQTVLRGSLNIFPVPGRILGSADKLDNAEWPQLVTYLNHTDIAVALDLALAEWVVQLAPEEQAGFAGRDWTPVFLTSDKHKAYAFQWFALAGISIVLWVFNGFRRARENKKMTPANNT
jgi:surfeit locus 1 family protein